MLLLNSSINNRLTTFGEYVFLASTTSTTTINIVTVDNLNNYQRLALYLGSTTDLNTSSFINYMEISTQMFKNTSKEIQTRYSDSNYAGCLYVSDTSVKLFTRASEQIAILYGIK